MSQLITLFQFYAPSVLQPALRVAYSSSIRLPLDFTPTSTVRLLWLLLASWLEIHLVVAHIIYIPDV
jgi:hypothetical protein